MGGTVLSVSSRALLDACARLGLDTGQILQAARLDAATVNDPDARIPIEQMAALWQKAHELSNDPDLALHAIEVLPFGAYRVIDFLAATAPTIGAALQKVSEYFPLINDVVRLRCDSGKDAVALTLEAPAHPEAITRPYTEYTFAAIFLHTRMAANQRYPLIGVEFSHPQPADISEHRRIFDCPVVFGARVNRMIVSKDVWNTLRSGGNPDLFAVLETHARMLMDHLPPRDDIVGRVREAIDAELRGGDPRLESIAKRLAMSPRTLQRRLRDEGVVFNDLLDTMRYRAAKSYLARGDVAGTEVAFLLGFAEQSSFNRAFKRWSGITPTEYRRRAAAV